MKNILKNKFVLIAIALVVGLTIGWLIKPSSELSEETEEHNHVESIAGIPVTYTCSMHPQIRQNEPGDCPICGMDLIPLESESETTDPMSIAMSPTAMQLAGVQTMIVGNSSADKSIRLSGKIQADERYNYTQSAHIPGRIEKLAVNFTGEYVNKGQVLGQIYSPELATAQEELLQTQKIKETQPALFNAAKDKLRNWKLTDAQIEEILTTGKVTEQIPILANVSGYVTDKMVNLGDYVQRGEPIYQIADLSNVWVLFDIYESELQWIKKGDVIQFTVKSLPGETFTGKLTYIDPVIDPSTRVAKARLELGNPNLKFKPEMFVSGEVVSKGSSKDDSIVVPKTAVMWTGTRSVAYVKNVTNQAVTFQLREVTLGASLGSEYIITSGLESGEEIAINGTFSIDAAAQLAGKPSMMSPDGSAGMTGHNHGGMTGKNQETTSQTSAGNVGVSDKAKDALKPVFDTYFKLKDALTNDDLAESKSSANDMLASLGQVNMSEFQGNAHTDWMKYETKIKAALAHIKSQKDLGEIRKSFLSISDEMLGIAENFKPLSSKIHVQHCPMADSNRGADWLSLEEKVVNPYFGQAMLTCGEVTKTIY
ncbi:efflux RND transporter periplasmic adaptor subunit [Algoriphagus sp. D3-2-R+10]|uniref:efflux RND transporter periplasmic adaptor subunit n=1 Tax=Algoriphagus aurantiacus TaxID=3103948 RepID=UPI002B3D50D1|nr:efflux RND transporter periplasmic adaptor subunit [Algoriphagus sp. D3-2-R+10]MEB2775846.1 efflux RND transporter periplasmic adaptor subunit [Algoriphagus sp. D3-2-R+10]